MTTLASGSAGNAMLVRGASSALLVDAGLSAKQITNRLKACGVDPSELAGVLITHEHSDHTSALRVLLSKHNLPVYCNPLTARALQDLGLKHGNWRLFQNGHDFTVEEFTVRPFSVPHDAYDPVGFRISTRQVAFGILTDLGHAPRLALEMLRGVQALLIETNHDEAMLQNCEKRPWSVKSRILSKHGHLSNAAAAQVLVDLEAPELRQVILGHLSRDCNAPHLAEASVRAALSLARREMELHCADQETASPTFALI